MPSRPDIRRQVAVAAVVLFALASSATTVVQTLVGPAGTDQVSKLGRAIAEVRGELPAEGTIGYVTDKQATPQDPDIYFFLTQYFLAPLVVRNLAGVAGDGGAAAASGPVDGKAPIIGHFESERNLRLFEEETGYEVERRIDDRLYLLR